MVASSAMMLVLWAALLVGATPKPGVYYRAAFAAEVERGAFDPDTYVTHREPSLSFNPPMISLDSGQEIERRRVRWTKSGTVSLAESRGVDATDWTPCVMRVSGRDRIDTDLLDGALETLVRLPLSFEALAKRERARRTELRRQAVIGLSRAGDGRQIRLEAKTPFEIHRCLPSCRREKATWCVSLGPTTWQLDDENQHLTEVLGPAGLCPDGRAFEPMAGARRYQRSH